MKRIIIFVILGCTQVLSVWAQCPPGQIMQGEQSGPGWRAPICVPDSNSAAAAPSVVWKDQWGAIASSKTSGALAAAVRKSDQALAEQIALETCNKMGSNDCEILITYHNGCGVMAEEIGSSLVHVQPAAAATKELAEDIAIKRCEEYTGRKCKIAYSGCSLAVRVQ